MSTDRIYKRKTLGDAKTLSPGLQRCLVRPLHLGHLFVGLGHEPRAVSRRVEGQRPCREGIALVAVVAVLAAVAAAAVAEWRWGSG